jgi:hypothetical protein
MPSSIWENFIGEKSTWFWTMAQAIAVVVSLVLILRQLMLQRYSNLLDTLERLDARWHSDKLVRQRCETCKEFLDKKHPKSKEITHKEGDILSFFEDLGLFLRRNVIDTDIAWESYSYCIEPYWQLMEPAIREFRTTTRDNSWFSNFEYLAKAMAKVSIAKHAQNPVKSDEEMLKFLSGESRLLTGEIEE